MDLNASVKKIIKIKNAIDSGITPESMKLLYKIMQEVYNWEKICDILIDFNKDNLSIKYNKQTISKLLDIGETLLTEMVLYNLYNNSHLSEYIIKLVDVIHTDCITHNTGKELLSLWLENIDNSEDPLNIFNIMDMIYRDSNLDNRYIHLIFRLEPSKAFILYRHISILQGLTTDEFNRYVRLSHKMELAIFKSVITNINFHNKLRRYHDRYFEVFSMFNSNDTDEAGYIISYLLWNDKTNKDDLNDIFIEGLYNQRYYPEKKAIYTPKQLHVLRDSLLLYITSTITKEEYINVVNYINGLNNPHVDNHLNDSIYIGLAKTIIHNTHDIDDEILKNIFKE